MRMGNQLWVNDIDQGLPLGNPHVVGLDIDGSGGVYMEFNFLTGIGDVTGYQTSKFNPDGSTAWNDFNPTGNGYSRSTGFVLDGMSNVLVTGYAPTAFNSQFPYFSYATYKYNSNGSNLWSADYPSISTSTNVSTSVAVDQFNDAYVTGYLTLSNGGSAISTVKYDPNGNQLWVERYNSQGSGNAAGNAIAVDNSGNVYVTGYETETNGFTSMILIKYSPVTLQKQPNGNFILHAYGSPGETFDIQASTNLQTWQELGNAVADTNGVVQFADTNAPSFNQRFYYAVPQ